jgi:predicted TIM-barrel fold metal-dependent hydrolase
MIVDVHSHAWAYPDHFSETFRRESILSRGYEIDLTVRWQEYKKTASVVEKSIVCGGKARLAGIWVPDDYIADYVKASEGSAIGFLSLDPTQPGWQDELRYGHVTLGMRGVKLLPMYAGFYPNDPKLDPLWDYCQANSLPVLLHTGTTFISQAPLDCTRPIHLDDVARRYPELRLILAHLSHPYEGECVAVIRKHPHVYADVSALYYRPFQLYHSLMLVQEYGVWNKLLFVSDYPFTTIEASIEGLHSLNNMLDGTALPRLSIKAIDELINRDALTLLGIA